jgi:hypothetical protein
MNLKPQSQHQLIDGSDDEIVTSVTFDFEYRQVIRIR